MSLASIQKIVSVKRARNFKDLTGQRFHRLTAESRDPASTAEQGSRWWCVCDCGKRKSILMTNFVYGKTKSCGCLQKEASKTVGKRFRGEFGASSKRDVYSAYKKRAKDLNLPFDIEFDKFIALTQKTCFYCGALPSNKVCHRKFKDDCFIYNGLDRLDSFKGYTEDNVVTCCYTCNKAKSQLSLEEFIDWLGRAHKKVSDFVASPGSHYLIYAD